MVYVPGVLKTTSTGDVVAVAREPPWNVHRMESGEPTVAVDVLVNLKVPAGQTTVSLTVKEAVAVGRETTGDIFILST